MDGIIDPGAPRRGAHAQGNTPARLRLAAVDLDGTLLAPDLSISAENLSAIARLRSAGMEVVVASGRHYSSVLQFASQLEGVRWIVSAQGAEVSDLSRSVVLDRAYLPRGSVVAAVDLGVALKMPAVAYTPDAILTDSDDAAAIAFYSGLTGLRPVRVATDELKDASVHKIVWIGQPEELSGLADDARVQALGVQTVRSHVRLFEFIGNNVTKASGLAALARHLGIDARESVVFGDAENDIPMFQWAGLAVAMPHAWPAAKAHAHRIAPDGAPETAFARAVQVVTPD